MKKPIALIILDGWGHREDPEHNAVVQADTPNFDRLWNEFPHTLLEASGEHVGLPKGQMGNSEIGHTTIGAGAVIDTDLVRINKAAESEGFSENSVFQTLFAHVKEHNSTLHIMGLVSAGGVHSHHDHLYAFLRTAKTAGVTSLAIHAFTDGRDTAPRSAAEYLENLENFLTELGIGTISTVSGRFYAMDRDNNWDRLAEFEDALFHGEITTTHTDRKPSAVIRELYEAGKVDEHLSPMRFAESDGKEHEVSENDAFFIFNFRSDRSRMLTRKAHEYSENHNILLATMTEYDPDFEVAVAFPPLTIETTLAAEISKAGLRQTHIAETEKFPHATYFLNGGRENPHDNEDHVMLESRKDVKTHDLAPKMRAEGIADAAKKSIENGSDFIFINFANADMVGHTGNVPAIIEGVEEVDAQLGRVVEAVTEAGGVCIITADHGNAEVNKDHVTGETHTAHTLNQVPCILTGDGYKLRESGSLADLAPTTLELLDIEEPTAMTGRSLIIKRK